MIGENFKVLFESLDPQLMRDVAKLYEIEAVQEAAACEIERADIGAFNQDHPVALRDGLGGIRHRLHSTDYWAQQIIHNAPNDPDLWTWFLKTPEGAYARMPTPEKAQIVVPQWKVGLWSTVRDSLAA